MQAGSRSRRRPPPVRRPERKGARPRRGARSDRRRACADITAVVRPRLVAARFRGRSAKRMMGLEPTTFCMAKVAPFAPCGTFAQTAWLAHQRCGRHIVREREHTPSVAIVATPPWRPGDVIYARGLPGNRITEAIPLAAAATTTDSGSTRMSRTRVGSAPSSKSGQVGRLANRRPTSTERSRSFYS